MQKINGMESVVQLIPCEICGKSFPAHVYMDHVAACQRHYQSQYKNFNNKENNQDDINQVQEMQQQMD